MGPKKGHYKGSTRVLRRPRVWDAAMRREKAVTHQGIWVRRFRALECQGISGLLNSET